MPALLHIFPCFPVSHPTYLQCTAFQLQYCIFLLDFNNLEKYYMESNAGNLTSELILFKRKKTYIFLYSVFTGRLLTS